MTLTIRRSTPSSSGCTWRTPAGPGATSSRAPSRRNGPIATSWRSLVAEEVAHRQQTRLRACVRRAHFPFLKTIDEFDFTYQSTVRLALLGSALAPEFVTRRPVPDPQRASPARQDAPRRRDRLPRDPERLRRALHHRRRAHRRPLRRLPQRASFADALAAYTPARASSSSTRSATSRTAPTPPTCSFTSSTIAIARSAP